MSIAHCFFKRPIAAGLILFLAMPVAQAFAEDAQQVAGAGSQPQDSASVQAPQPIQSQGTESSAQSSPANSSQQTQPAQDKAQQPAQSGSGKPVGTAAAPVEKTTGITASRPAGAVIAPAKQRRARSILIRVGVVVGAAVAIGIVIGASKASNSRPGPAGQ
jgi:hypothetical protein